MAGRLPNALYKETKSARIVMEVGGVRMGGAKGSEGVIYNGGDTVIQSFDIEGS